MKKPLHFIVFFLFCLGVKAQKLTGPFIKGGNFGIEGEVQANLYGSSRTIGPGTDDWYPHRTTPTSYPNFAGAGVIDTTGAAAAAATKLPFYRTMSRPQYDFDSITGIRWIDAVFIRDYNGQDKDSTRFALGSNKNGDNPTVWTGAIQPVPQKNDIADIMLHVRREGIEKNANLWFMGGIAIHGTGGQRYFDFELYQTDIFYNRSTQKFTNEGPEAGHTAWQFDASGNITKPGDVIFTAVASSQKIDTLKTRIWVDRSALSLTPNAFDWGGAFDGASNGSQYGYAEIVPKNGVTEYYWGFTNGNANTSGYRWAGPFGYLDRSNTLQTDYLPEQFGEFAVDLTLLGLDPITLLGGDACGLPFRRILVKTRTSASFTAELADFIGPFDFFSTPPVQAQADVPVYCGVMGASTISVLNPLAASVYTWKTLDGRIVTDSTGTFITVDTTGTYIVEQQLLDGCRASAADTVIITFDGNCTPLQKVIINIEGGISNKKAMLKWTSAANDIMHYYEVERSADGQHFSSVQRIYASNRESALATYPFEEDVSAFVAPFLYYRVKAVSINSEVNYSRIVKMQNERGGGEMVIYPNPAHRYIALSMPASRRTEAVVSVIGLSGKAVYHKKHLLQQGLNEIVIDEITRWSSGVYLVNVSTENGSQWQKVIINTTRQ